MRREGVRDEAVSLQQARSLLRACTNTIPAVARPGRNRRLNGIGAIPRGPCDRLVLRSVKRSLRLLICVAGIALVLIAGAPAVLAGPSDVMIVATEEVVDETTTTVDPNAPVPAEVAPPVEDDADEAPWTTRFMIPLFLVLGGLGLVGSILFYGARVRGRYTVVR